MRDTAELYDAQAVNCLAPASVIVMVESKH